MDKMNMQKQVNTLRNLFIIFQELEKKISQESRITRLTVREGEIILFCGHSQITKKDFQAQSVFYDWFTVAEKCINNLEISNLSYYPTRINEGT